MAIYILFVLELTFTEQYSRPVGRWKSILSKGIELIISYDSFGITRKETRYQNILWRFNGRFLTILLLFIKGNA